MRVAENAKARKTPVKSGVFRERAVCLPVGGGDGLRCLNRAAILKARAVSIVSAMRDLRFPYLYVSAVLAAAIMFGMPVLARLNPKPKIDYWQSLRPKTYPTTGQVLYEGKPVGGAFVSFLTMGQSTGCQCTASAATDEDGYFVVRTSHHADGIGAAAGKHQITITKMVPTGRMMSETEFGMGLGPEFPEARSFPEMVHGLPQRFAESATSGLFVTITPDRTNHVVIRLTKEPPPGVQAAEVVAGAVREGVDDVPPSVEHSGG